MKKLTLLFILLAVISLALSAQESSDSAWRSANKPMVIVTNLGTEGMDVMIGDEDDTVFYTYDLSEFDTTALTPVDYSGTYNLYCMYPDDDDWSLMVNEGTDDPYTVTLQDGKVLGLVITPDNIVYDFELTYKNSGSAKIMFANLTDDYLDMLEVSNGFGDKDVVWCDGLDDYSLSNFGDAASGSYNLFWQTPAQEDDETYFFYPDDDGEPELKTVSYGSWYQMMIYTKDGDSYCNFFEITPKESYTK